MLSFSLVAEALTGLIYHRPSGENSKKKRLTSFLKTRNFDKQAEKFLITPVKKQKNINVIDITGHAYVVLMPHTSY